MKERYALWSAIVVALGGIIVAFIQNNGLATRQQTLIDELNNRTIPQLENALKSVNTEIRRHFERLVQLEALLLVCCKDKRELADSLAKIKLPDTTASTDFVKKPETAVPSRYKSAPQHTLLRPLHVDDALPE